MYLAFIVKVATVEQSSSTTNWAFIVKVKILRTANQLQVDVEVKKSEENALFLVPRRSTRFWSVVLQKRCLSKT